MANIAKYSRIHKQKKILADGGYRGEELKNKVKTMLGCDLEVVLRPDECPKKIVSSPRGGLSKGPSHGSRIIGDSPWTPNSTPNPPKPCSKSSSRKSCLIN